MLRRSGWRGLAHCVPTATVAREAQTDRQEAECNVAESVCASEPQRTGYEKARTSFHLECDADSYPIRREENQHLLSALSLVCCRSGTAEGCYGNKRLLRMNQTIAAMTIPAMAKRERCNRSDGCFFLEDLTSELLLAWRELLSAVAVNTLLLSAV